MSLLLKSILAASLFLFCATDERRRRTAERRKLEMRTIKVEQYSMSQNAGKMGEEAVYSCPHQLECCGARPAPGCARHCRGRDAMSRGPCTR